MQTLITAYNRNINELNVDFVRYLHNRIDWGERLIGIKGSRGVGKTTMLLQHIKMAFPERSQAFYVSLDNMVQQPYAYGYGGVSLHSWRNACFS